MSPPGRKVPVHISVYITKSRRSLSDRQHGRHHHHHYHRVHHHHHRGGNRKAELLNYSQQLRAKARTQKVRFSPDIIPKPASNNPIDKAVQLHRSPSFQRNPACLGDWKRVLLPSCILKSPFSFKKKDKGNKTVKNMNNSSTNTMHAIVKSFRVEKQQGLVKKLIKAFRRRS